MIESCHQPSIFSHTALHDSADCFYEAFLGFIEVGRPKPYRMRMEMIMGTNVSRREFLKGGTLVAATVAGAAMFNACSASEEGSDSVSDKPWLPKKWDYETDVLIIGYGGAGGFAALAAYDEGAQVIILEKAPFRGGGSSSINMGQWTVPHDADSAAEYVIAACKGTAPEAVFRTWAKAAVESAALADKYGIEYSLSTNAGESSNAEYHNLPGSDQMAIAQCIGYGYAAFETVDQHIKDRGIQIVFSCHDEHLIQDPITKEILGTYTYIGNDGVKYAVKAAKATIITTGGFEFNREMQANYLKCYPQLGMYAWIFNTGDGLRMAQEVGADLWHMQGIVGGWGSFFDDPDVVKGGLGVSIPTSNYIEVDRLGNRFMTEGLFEAHNGWKHYQNFNESIVDFDRIPAWYIFDDTAFKGGTMGSPVVGRKTAEGGMGIGYQGLWDEAKEKGEDYSELGAFEGWSADNQWELERGWILKGDTVEELASMIQKADPNPNGEGFMTAAALQDAVSRWNAMCDRGVDEDFGRAPEKMAKIETAPFYAVNVYPGKCNTTGGARRNEKANVLDPDGNEILRLFSAGSFGNMQGHTYALTGGNGSENIVWGTIAGENAAALDAWDK
jgi:hypothetical protein